MKIISKHKDYYDGVQAYGVDQTQVFARKQEVLEVELPAIFEQHLGKWYDFSRTYDLQNKNASDLRLIENFSIVGFCGAYHVGCQFIVVKNETIISTKTFFSAIDSIAHYQKLEKQYGFEDPYYGYDSDRETDHIRTFFSSLENAMKAAVFTTWFADLDTPYFLFPYKNYQLALPNFTKSATIQQKKTVNIQLHPNLQELDFYRIYNPYECYQHIAQYRFGVLTKNENHADKRTDDEKIENHGFDKKYGFRNRGKK